MERCLVSPGIAKGICLSLSCLKWLKELTTCLSENESVLKVIAGMYDPLGLVSPVLVIMKVISGVVCEKGRLGQGVDW